MNRLDYLLKEKERIEREIDSIKTGEVVNDIAKLHTRQYKLGNYFVKEEREDWALSIRRRNLETGFSKWEPIVASKSRDKVIEGLEEIVDSLNSILKEVKTYG